VENAVGSVLFNALNNAPTFEVRDDEGNFTLAEGLGNEIINPLHQIDNTFNSNKTDRLSGKIGGKYSLFKNFSIESNFQFNYSETQNRTFTPISFFGSGKVFNNQRTNEGLLTSRLSVNKNIFRDYTWDNLIKYQKVFNEEHDLSVLFGTSIFENSGKFSGDTFGFFDETTGVDFITADFENATEELENAQVDAGNSGKFKNTLLSYFARLQYSYQGKYLFSGVIRRDGSSVFGPENRFGYFPSTSLGWIISEENFLTDNKFVDFLKLRASYGVIGNDRIPSNSFRSVLNGEAAAVFNDELAFGEAIGKLANPEIKWEEQTTLDIGFDLKLFNNAVDITVDYFNRRTDDLLVDPPVSGILGASAPGSSAPTVNAGSIRNSGFEFSIGYNSDPSKDFSYGVNYNATFLDNEVLSVNNGVGFIDDGSFSIGQDPPARFEAGRPIGYFLGLETNGIFQNQNEIDAHATQANSAPGDLRFVDQNGDGVIDVDDRVEIGSPIADATMGLNISMNYKNFDFGAYTFASFGNEIVRNYEQDINLANKSVFTLNRWTGEGSTNTYPRVTTGATSNSLFSDFFVEDGSFVRIQNAQIGYTIPNEIINRLGASKLRFYISANNLYTFTKYRGFDPSASSGAPIGAGIDSGFYPVPRTYLLGVNFKF